MKTSPLTFELQEIPDGKSTRNVSLDEDSLELDDDTSLLNADVHVEFFRTDLFIRVWFEVSADTTLICDRTLKPFTETVLGDYEVMFYPETPEEHETDKGKVKEIDAENLTISIDEEVRDTIMLQIPIRKLHPDLIDQDGKPVEFETQVFGKNVENEDGSDQPIDPRWEKLKKLKKSN
ncbi:YceD family protein [Rhodohalobacter mucosus]|uniref:DUF177 domain-containing protein n=1 Tax=Rhodohalobacter mucosus TaxID=2079485 RepID=A0A316TUP5_9BACT|nr:DUF177 domain-containing protein [Rhodohalobacter mucosus]PWN07431.1 DUF177 domain-containing protein [Rhodohalobacter mucosus]